MADTQIYPLATAWTLLFVALIAMRIVAYVSGNRLPLFYDASRHSARLSPDRLHRYQRLRSTGLKIGILTIAVSLILGFAADAGVVVRTLSYCVGLLVVLSSVLYLEYCMATGNVSPETIDPSRASKLF